MVLKVNNNSNLNSEQNVTRMTTNANDINLTSPSRYNENKKKDNIRNNFKRAIYKKK